MLKEKLSQQEIDQQKLPAHIALKAGDIVWRVNEMPVDWSPENPYRLSSYEITKVGKIHIWYVQLGLPRKLQPRRCLTRDFFSCGIHLDSESCLNSFRQSLLKKISIAERNLRLRQEDYITFQDWVEQFRPEAG